MSADLEEQYNKIYRYCYMKLGHRQTAEDLTQETFLRFFADRRYQDMGRELAYLYTIARNQCIDYYRKQKPLAMPEEYRKNLGYLPQDFGYYPGFTGLEFLDYMALLKGLPRSAAKKRSQELLELVGLKNDSKKRLKRIPAE